MAEIEIGPAEAGSTQAVTVGDKLVVALDETPTSGYRWAMEAFDESVLAAQDNAYVPPEGERLGASGQHRFRFTVVGPGSTALRLVRRRSWDPDSAAATFEASIEASIPGGSGDPGRRRESR
jgi:inhibitor of cysteine peptidase